MELKSDTVKIRKPDDFHLHLRQGSMLEKTVCFSSDIFERALVMPNTLPPVFNAKDVERYRNEIKESANKGADTRFEPLMTFKLSPAQKEREIAAMLENRVLAAKYYPAGATTNSEDAISNWRDVREQLSILEKLDIPLSIHAEDPEAPVFYREQAFLAQLDKIRNCFPSLRIVFEHISSKEGVRWLKEQDDKVGATVTLHHLLYTVEDLLGGAMKPHLFCRPLLKRDEDREALRDLVFNASPNVFFGSDSAPHPVNRKECSGSSAGIFSSPVLLPSLVELFENSGTLEKLESFVSEKGAQFYKLPVNRGTITLRKESNKAADSIRIDDKTAVVPLKSGESLQWKLIQG